MGGENKASLQFFLKQPNGPAVPARTLQLDGPWRALRLITDQYEKAEPLLHEAMLTVPITMFVGGTTGPRADSAPNRRVWSSAPVSEAHLKRNLREFDFRYSNREKLGVDDVSRAELAVKGMKGKRLTYETTLGASSA